MWTRFTVRARRVVEFAQEEAVRYVGTEHLLLGLIREDSVAGKLLASMGISPERIRAEVERQVAPGPGIYGEDVKLAPRSKRVIDLAHEEARRLDNNYIGTEHLLLGLVSEGIGTAGRVLEALGATLERTRQEVERMQQSEAVQRAKAEDGEA